MERIESEYFDDEEYWRSDEELLEEDSPKDQSYLTVGKKIYPDTSKFDVYEGELDMDQVAAWFHENRYEFDAENARKFLRDNYNRIDWNWFDEWFADVEGTEGYDWLKEIDAYEI